MNTLAKSITRHFFISEGGYRQLVERWSEFANDPELRKTLGPEHYLAYAILRGKDWRKGFSPITNSKKLANGLTAYGAACEAVYRVSRALDHPVFEGLLSHEARLIHTLLRTPDSETAYKENLVADLGGKAA